VPSLRSALAKGTPTPREIRPGRAPHLTKIEREFVDAYLADPTNIAEAVRKTSSRTKRHRQTGQKLLARPHVQAVIDAATERTLDRLSVDAQWVMERLAIEATNMANTGGERIRALEVLARMFPERFRGAETSGQAPAGLTIKVVQEVQRRVLGLPGMIDAEVVE